MAYKFTSYENLEKDIFENPLRWYMVEAYLKHQLKFDLLTPETSAVFKSFVLTNYQRFRPEIIDNDWPTAKDIKGLPIFIVISSLDIMNQITAHNRQRGLKHD